jgi:hypothetical protein
MEFSEKSLKKGKEPIKRACKLIYFKFSHVSVSWFVNLLIHSNDQINNIFISHQGFLKKNVMYATKFFLQSISWVAIKGRWNQNHVHGS